MLFSLLLAVLLCVLIGLCHFVELSELLVDLRRRPSSSASVLLFGNLAFVSFVNFFSSLAVLAVILSLFSVFWYRLLQALLCGSLRLRGSASGPPPTPLLRIAPLRDCWFAVGALAPREGSLQQCGAAVSEVWFLFLTLLLLHVLG